MAVTTGTTTGSTNTNKTSSNPSGGGPGGGSLSAPARTAPSSGLGGQGSGASKTGSTASKASTAQSSAPGKTDKEAPAPTSAPGKTDKVGTSEISKKPGLAGIQGAAQQAAFDKQKDLYTQAGGASASMRQAQMAATKPTNSVKVTDPSRGGITSRGSGTATPWGGSMTTAGKTDNMAKQPSSAPGKTNKEPSLDVARPTNQGLTGSGTATPWGGSMTMAGKTRNMAKQPESNLLDKTNRQAMGSGTQTAWGGPTAAPTSTASLKTAKQPSPTVARPTNQSFIDRLGVAQPGGLTVNGSIMGMQPTRPSLSQTIARDPITFNGPRAETTPATPAGYGPMEQAIRAAQDSLTAAEQGPHLRTSSVVAGEPTPPMGAPRVGAPTPKVVDRVPAEMPTARVGADPRLAQMQEQYDRIAAGRGQPTNATFTREPAAPMPQGIPAPASTGIMPAQPSVPQRQGQITNPMYRDPMAQANAVRAAVAMALGQAPQKPNFQNASAPAPTTPQRQPLQINIPGGPPQVAPSQQGAIGAQGGLGVQAYRGDVTNPPLNVPGNSTTQQRDEYYGGGPTDVASPIPGGGAFISPSQGNYPADENFLQDDGQPQSLGELKNRYDYEKGLAKRGLKELPGRLYDAITRGDIRGYTPEANDRGQERRYAPPSKPAPTMSQGDAQAVAQLIALVTLMEQQQSSGLTQADLVNSTFQ